MVSYVILGTNDVQASDRFYSALLEPLGYEKRDDQGALAFSLADAADRNGPVAVYIKIPLQSGYFVQALSGSDATGTREGDGRLGINFVNTMEHRRSLMWSIAS